MILLIYSENKSIKKNIDTIENMWQATFIQLNSIRTCHRSSHTCHWVICSNLNIVCEEEILEHYVFKENCSAEEQRNLFDLNTSLPTIT